MTCSEDIPHFTLIAPSTAGLGKLCLCFSLCLCLSVCLSLPPSLPPLIPLPSGYKLYEGNDYVCFIGFYIPSTWQDLLAE
jgi:hypothetical protein